jgi:hypothetical protein
VSSPGRVPTRYLPGHSRRSNQIKQERIQIELIGCNTSQGIGVLPRERFKK